MLPAAPGLCSMINGWAVRSLQRAATARSTTSEGPPGANGTITRSGAGPAERASSGHAQAAADA
jgi:hypothetical protein